MSFTSPWKIIPLTRVVFMETLTVLSRDGVSASAAVASPRSVKDVLGAEFLGFLLIDFRLPVEIPLQLLLDLQMSCQHEQQRSKQVLMARRGTALAGLALEIIAQSSSLTQANGICQTGHVTEQDWDRDFWFLRESWPNEGKELEKSQKLLITGALGMLPTSPLLKTQGKLPFTFPARGLKPPGP